MFSGADRALIEALGHDGNASYAFELIKGCLVWSDEVPQGLSREGYELLGELLSARGMMHLGSQLDAIPEPYRTAWESAVAAGLRWPGFSRLELSEDERRYLEHELNESSDGF